MNLVHLRAQFRYPPHRPPRSQQQGRRWLTTMMALCCATFGFACQAEPPLASDWVQLFDGETLFGWHVTSDANWRTERGEIVADAGSPGFLMSDIAFGDFELTLEFHAAADTNSGVFVRSSNNPKNPQVDCYEINIAGTTNPFPTGSIVARRKGEDISIDYDEWQRLTVTADKNRITVDVNGHTTSELIDEKPRRKGHIGLQFNQGLVRFRNIRLRPLHLQPIFNGQNLDGWHTHPDLSGKFLVQEGALRVRGGLGQLETNELYDNFVLQFECRTNAPGVNSGLFFRCIPHDKLMGYESQIHNGFQDGDRKRPTDCGTGGIFRRQAARRVVANDLEWFRETLMAVDDQIAVWVNGFQVCSWKDQRSPDENPRRGKRLTAGTILVQAHDATTDVSFRKLRIVRVVRDEAPSKPRLE